MSYNALRKGRVSLENQEYFITFCVHKRLDIFLNPELANTFCRQLMTQQHEHGTPWLAWVLMPDHFHGIFRLNEGVLSKSIQALKGRSAKELNITLGRRGRVWQQGFFDRTLRKEESRIAIARYIVANPLRAGLVKRVGDYPYWDSVWL